MKRVAEIIKKIISPFRRQPVGSTWERKQQLFAQAHQEIKREFGY